MADHADWTAPGWYGGNVTIDADLGGPLDCQARCFASADCDYFSYEWEFTAGGMYHECYLKTAYEDALCMVDPYVNWASQDSTWHGQSGPGIACASPLELTPACQVLQCRLARQHAGGCRRAAAAGLRLLSVELAAPAVG